MTQGASEVVKYIFIFSSSILFNTVRTVLQINIILISFPVFFTSISSLPSPKILVELILILFPVDVSKNDLFSSSLLITLILFKLFTKSFLLTTILVVYSKLLILSVFTKSPFIIFEIKVKLENLNITFSFSIFIITSLSTFPSIIFPSSSIDSPGIITSFLGYFSFNFLLYIA